MEGWRSVEFLDCWLYISFRLLFGWDDSAKEVALLYEIFSLCAVDLVEVKLLIVIVDVAFDEFDLADGSFAYKWDAKSL